VPITSKGGIAVRNYWTPDEEEALKEALGLRFARKGGYPPGSSFDTPGVERVIQASALLKLLRGEPC
jgi:hypothetical protein